MYRFTIPALALASLLIGCGDSTPAEPTTSTEAPKAVASSSSHPVTYSEEREACDKFSETRMPLFGDLHVHTSFSFDAAAISIGATPVDANNFAKGEPIDFWPIESGRPVGKYRLDRPLDFLAVTDHGEFLGERRLCYEEDSESYDSHFCKAARVNQRQGMIMFGQVITTETPARIPEVCGEDGEMCREYAKSPWERMAEAAEEAYDKTSACSFTSFVAYEYTGTPGTSNYHRNVIFRNGNVPELPVSYIDAPFDSALWEGLDTFCDIEDGCDYLTIPHNTNLANGRMAPYMRLADTVDAKRAYAETRLKREPIMEIFQHKGGSECINGLASVLASPDELCDVEAVRVIGQEETYATRQLNGSELVMGTATLVTEECEPGEIGSNGMLGAGCVDATDYQRSALLVGLEQEAEIGLNPVKLGIIAATDTHTATPGAVHENDWRGAVSSEATPALRLEPGLLTSNIDGNPGGLAGVWAVENSRDAIFDAMLRREVFGTSGPRIVPRFFAGWGYDAGLCDADDMVEQGYAGGVPMGGDLSAPPSAEAKPVFIANALRDPADYSLPLEQLQLIKGWIDADGQRRNEVITLAGGKNPEATVNLETGEANGDGHDSLCAVYTDDSFDPDLPTYYYVRAVENPAARWTVFDCQRLPEDERPAVCSDGSYPSTIQEMAWTSPIWYAPQPKRAQ